MTNVPTLFREAHDTLHTSGHAYVETIANLIKTVDPKWILPMHTET